MENNGYFITHLIATTGEGESVSKGFCLGFNRNAPSPYVTWRFQKENETYYFFSGNYFGERRSAIRDFYQRLVNYYSDE